MGSLQQQPPRASLRPMANNFSQHILILGYEAQATRFFVEELLASAPVNDVRYTLVHPNGAQILLRLEGIDYAENPLESDAFANLLNTADGIMCLIPLETGIAETLTPWCEKAGIKRVVFCTREANYHPPAAQALAAIHSGVQRLVISNLDWTVLRCSTLWGGADDPFVAFCQKLKTHRSRYYFIGQKTADTFLQPMHERDLAEGIIKAFPHAETFRQSYTLGGAKPLRIGFILPRLCEKEGKTLKILPFWGRQRLLPKWLLLARKNQPLNIGALRRSLINTHQKALRDFGYMPQTPMDFMKKGAKNA